jgi:hypothetical protein
MKTEWFSQKPPGYYSNIEKNIKKLELPRRFMVKISQKIIYAGYKILRRE